MLRRARLSPAASPPPFSSSWTGEQVDSATRELLQSKGYFVQIPWPVSWGSIDVHQHVSNNEILRLYEHARVTYLERVGVAVDNGGVGPIVSKIGAVFKAPINYPGPGLVLCAKTAEIKQAEGRFVLRHAVYDLSVRGTKFEGKLASEGDAIVVSYDYKNLKKAPLPEFWIENIKRVDVI